MCEQGDEDLLAHSLLSFQRGEMNDLALTGARMMARDMLLRMALIRGIAGGKT